MKDFELAFTEDRKGSLMIDGKSYPAELAAASFGQIHRFFVYPDETNSKGEKLVLEFSIGYWGKDSKLWNSWIRHGWTTKKDTLLFLSVFSYQPDGTCWGKYNPQVKLSDDGKRTVVDFDYLPEADADGYRLLMNETMRRFKEAGV